MKNVSGLKLRQRPATMHAISYIRCLQEPSCDSFCTYAWTETVSAPHFTPAPCTALTPTLCSNSGLQHKERCLSRHEAQRLGHRGTAEDQAILEKIPGKHWPFGEWPEESKLSFPQAKCNVAYTVNHVWAIHLVELWHVVSNEYVILAHIYYS